MPVKQAQVDAVDAVDAQLCGEIVDLRLHREGDLRVAVAAEGRRGLPVSAAARRCGLGWHLVMALVRCWSGLAAEHRRSQVLARHMRGCLDDRFGHRVYDSVRHSFDSIGHRVAHVK